MSKGKPDVSFNAHRIHFRPTSGPPQTRPLAARTLDVSETAPLSQSCGQGGQVQVAMAQTIPYSDPEG